MSLNKFISFVIPCRNNANTIAKCLESIQKADYPSENIEIIIADNGSKDSTRDIACNFTNKIYINKNATVAQLRNIGAAQAKGYLIAFIDADCIIEKDWIKNAAEYFNNSAVGMVGTRTLNIPKNASWIERTCHSR